MPAVAVTEEALTAQANVDDESAFFAAATDILHHLTARLTDRPHGQFSLLQLPDIFIIKYQLDQIFQVKAKGVKNQETLLAMAEDREEEGGKSSKKRVKTSGAQATAIRQIVAEEAAKTTSELQLSMVSLKDKAKIDKKLLEFTITENERLKDRLNFLELDFNKAAKAPKMAAQKNDHHRSMESRLVDLEGRARQHSKEISNLTFVMKDTESALQDAHDALADHEYSIKVSRSTLRTAEENVANLRGCDRVNDQRHDATNSQIEMLLESDNNHAKFMDRHAQILNSHTDSLNHHAAILSHHDDTLNCHCTFSARRGL